jgi:transposase InsO family protein
MDPEVRKRLSWINLYTATKDAGLTCRKCGISRPTLRKWLKRFDEHGLEGLASKSRRPHHSPAVKVQEQQEDWILELRKERKLGVRRIQHEIERQHSFHLSLATIQKVLKKHNLSVIRQKRRKQPPKRYSKSLPGECIQIDTIKIGPGKYQYTAIDDYSRFVVAEIYPRRTAANSLDFLEFVLDAFPVPIQRIQTDRGSEFMADKVQLRLMELHIKFRPNKPGSPHLNGKVERVQQTILTELYSWTNLKSETLSEELGVWLMYYNYQRIHGSLGTAPVDKLCERIYDAPTGDEVYDSFDPTKERFRDRNYEYDQLLAEMMKKDL